MSNICKIKRFLPMILFLTIFSLPERSWAADFYMTQTQAGSNDGSSCVNAHAATWFNTAANWANPKQAGKVGPGDTVHLCGTFTFPANDSSNGLLKIPGSGSAGSPITILFEAGAKLQSPQFSTNGAIMCHWYWGCHGNVMIDGGTDGIIENTANGTGLAYHAASTGVVVSGWSNLQTTSNVEVKNLTIRNIYLNLGSSPTASDTDGQSTTGISIGDNLANISIHNNTVSNSRTGIGGTFDGSTWDNIDIYNNYINDHCWGMSIAGLSPSSKATNVKIHNNEITDWLTWQCPADARYCNDKTDVYHTDGIITWSGNIPGTPVYAPLIYNNYIHGNLGNGSATGFIYCTVGNPIANTTSGSECIIFNNLLVGEDAGAGRVWFGGNTENNKLYNNTFIGPSSNPSSTFNPCIISSSLGGDIYKNNICMNFSQVFATQWANDPAQFIAAMDDNAFYT